LVKGTITITGQPGDIFIFNVTAGFSFSSSKMILSGGVKPSNIIWNFAGPGPDINIFKDVTTAYGFFLAPERSIDQDHAVVTGAYIARNVKLHSGAQLIYPACN